MADLKYVRSPAVARLFYPEEGGELRQRLADLIQLSPFGYVVHGVVVPHAGYIYSGRLAGQVYGKVHIPDQVILLGPNHTGRGLRASVMAEGMWEIPLGRVPVDEELAEALMGSCSVLEKDTEAHRAEHSLEVQVPFLYYLNPRVRIVPIVLMPNSLEECVRMGEEIARVIQGWTSSVLIVASTDMTHYEPRLSAREKDRLAIEQMMALNPEGLYQTVTERKISMCGFIPTTVALAAWRALGVTGMEFVGYSDSGDTSGDTTRVVGYAGLIVRG